MEEKNKRNELDELGEFGLIDRITKGFENKQDSTILGIGDDAAICNIPAHQELVVSIDTFIVGVHCPLNTSAQDIAYKALAVNLSDMAAMGAQPAWFTLALTCPSVDETWLSAFSHSLFTLAQQHQIDLIGGDTTRVHLSITIQIAGFVAQGQALTRATAQVGDDIYVTGTLGDAGLGLKIAQQQFKCDDKSAKFCLQRLNRPTAQVATGLALRGIATSAIDLSDGLYPDLNHILTASGVGADLNLDAIPLSLALKHNLSQQKAQQLALTAGDDYELCFTTSPENRALLATSMDDCQRIGSISAKTGLRCFNANGQTPLITNTGYRHF